MTSTGSSAPSNEPEQKEEQKQGKDDQKELYLSVVFSGLEYEGMTTYMRYEKEVDGKTIVFFAYNYVEKPEWETGSISKVDKAIYIDCSRLELSEKQNKVEDDDGMVTLLNKALREITIQIKPFLKRKQKVKVHFNLSADIAVQDLLYGLYHFCEQKNSEKIKNKAVSSFASKKGSSYFKKYKKKDWTFSVDYACTNKVMLGYAIKDGGGEYKPKNHQ